MKRLLRIIAPILLLMFAFNGTAILAQDDTQPGLLATEANIDTTVPSDVENVRAIADNAQAILTWDAAIDGVGITNYTIHYGTQSVKEDGGEYNLEPIETENVTTYTVNNLENGVAYYFAVTARDAAGNESASFSFEVSATPGGSLHGSSVENDGKNPSIKQVTSVDSDTVKLLFSESVLLPLESPEAAFRITRTIDDQPVTVTGAALDSSDEKGLSVLLTVDLLEDGVTYLLAVGPEVKDLYENSVTTGGGDTATFRGKTGTDDTSDENGDSDTSFTLEKISSQGGTKIEVVFSQSVTLSDDPKTNFVIFERQSGSQKDDGVAKVELKIKNVSISKDGKTIFLQTDAQKSVDYVLVAVGVKDTAGREYVFAPNENDDDPEEGMVFKGNEPSLKDLVPPEDVTKLMARLKAGSSNIVSLTWKASVDSSKDLDNQLLYRSQDGGKTYGVGERLGKDPVRTDVSNLTPETRYTFKLAATDRTGNESAGAITSFFLTETGPGIAILGISALVTSLYRRRKKR